jgi:CRP-like cAMP-binding protein
MYNIIKVSVIKDNKEVYILNQCGHFGDEEMLIENSSRIYTVKVKSIKATIYKITRESFLKIIDDLFPILRSTFV